MPPAKSGDYAWVQHMLKLMARHRAHGRGAAARRPLSHGQEGKIRTKILDMDLLEAVIGLGPNLFYGTGLAACILVFRRAKKANAAVKVLILDASREFKTGRAQNELLPEHVERIYQWYRDYTDVEGMARVVTLEEIAANDHNLNIPRYVEPLASQVTLTVDDAMSACAPVPGGRLRRRSDWSSYCGGREYSGRRTTPSGRAKRASMARLQCP